MQEWPVNRGYENFVAMIDCQSFQSAIGQLETSLHYLHSEASRADSGLRRQFRAAVIQAFEFTYDLAIRMILRQLGEIHPRPAELREMSFMDLMRTAARAGLIREAPPFKAYRELRNLTSHSYDESNAERVLASVEFFLQEIQFLLSELQRRNRAAD